jgi:hypothetical protein
MNWNGLKLYKGFATLAQATAWKSQVSSPEEDEIKFSKIHIKYVAQHPPIKEFDTMTRAGLPPTKPAAPRTKSRLNGKGGDQK